MTCIRCGSEVCPDRADFLLECGKAVTCTSCSSEQPKMCLLEFGHKTAPSLVIVGNDPESVRMASRAFRRAR